MRLLRLIQSARTTFLVTTVVSATFVSRALSRTEKYLRKLSFSTSGISGNCLQAPKSLTSLLSSARRMVKPSPFQGEDYGFEPRAEYPLWGKERKITVRIRILH